jgi:two-component system NarL family sensor kinase
MTETPQFLKRMIVSAINAREVESARVSRLLHDEVGQVLSAVGLQLDVLKLDYRAQIPEITERIHEIQKMLDQAVRQVRTLSYDLNPSIVERAGLQSALDRLVGRFRTAFNGSIRFTYDPSVRVPADVANVWYKIAEIALENAVQHSRGTRIEVHVRSTSRQAMLEVRDDGCGFSTDTAPDEAPGLGLLLMEHYATQVPITVDLKSKPGKGTIVRASWNRPRGPKENPEP